MTNFNMNQKKPSFVNFVAFATLMICITMLFGNIMTSLGNKPQPLVDYEATTNEVLMEQVNNNEVQKVIISGNVAYFKTEEGHFKVEDFNTELTTLLELNELVEIKTVEKDTSVHPLTVVFIVLGAIGLFICLIMFGLTKSVESVAKSFPTMQEKGQAQDKAAVQAEKPTVTFDDVSGCDELKAAVQNDIDCLKNPALLKDMGARMPKGMVLYGPPGTGKTLIAKAIAGTAGVPFISASGSDFIEMYVGVGAQRIRSLYKEARAKAPCIVFIDEIDAIGGKRGMAQNSERDQTINALLTELDGFAGSEGILTICATNRLDMLDSALIRPGRFDKQLAVPLPDRAGRFAILTKHARNKRLAEDVDLTRLAEKTVDFSGAELEALLNESALIAISRKSKFITNDDIEEAFFRMLMKGNKRKGIRNEEENRLVAYHEAGHALATKLLTEDEIASVTIVGSTSGAGGVTIRTPKETVVQSKKYLRNLIKVMYAGRAAEYILLQDDDEITTGASADIEQATNLIKNYIGTYGMGENGMLALRAFENTDKEILKEAATMANTLYQETIDLLHKNSDKLDAIANELIVNESIEGDIIDAIISGNYDQLMMNENI